LPEIRERLRVSVLVPRARLYTSQRIQTTLLDLVWAVSQVTMTSDDRLVAATVAHLVNSGRARLTGTFKNARLIVG
jgi:hypothetical protein